MAEGDDSASKTEEATPRRIEEARKDGDVPKSADLAQVCALAGAFAAIAMGGAAMSRPRKTWPITTVISRAGCVL